MRLEAGVHRLREGQQASNAHVRVLPWREGHGQLELGEHRALKATGQPARIRDSLTGEARGGLPALRPETFHALLAERIRSSE